jgi:hypothetical protein
MIRKTSSFKIMGGKTFKALLGVSAEFTFYFIQYCKTKYHGSQKREMQDEIIKRKRINLFKLVTRLKLHSKYHFI